MNKFKKVVRDPIHGFITFNDKKIYEILNTKEFQRLMRIAQTTGVQFSYPGATQSRYSHCLGTYEIARRLVKQYRENFSDYERTLVMIAALLHDVGHGPLSHTFERFTNLSHEEYGQRIILTKETELHKQLKLIDPKLPQDLADVLLKKYKNPLISQIVSSQIDVDRMDYLLRDSHFTGVSYSIFDLNYLLRSLDFVSRDGKKQMVFKKSCIHVLEQYLVGRWHLYRKVIMNYKNIGFEILVGKVIKRARHLFNDGYRFKTDIHLLIPIFKFSNYTIKQYIQLTDYSFMTIILNLEKENDPVLNDLLSYLNHARFFRHQEYENEQQKEKILLELRLKKIDIDYYFEDFTSENIAYKSVGDIDEGNIYVINEKREIKKVDYYSPLLLGINKTKHTTRMLFYK